MNRAHSDIRNISFLLIILISGLYIGVHNPNTASVSESFYEFETSPTEDPNLLSMPRDMVESDEPSTFPHNIEFNVTSTEGFFDGYNLLVVARMNRTDYSLVNTSLLITDMNGNIVEEKADAALLPAPTFINESTIIYGVGVSKQQAVLWNIQDNITQSLPFYGHHEFEYNPNTNTVFTFKAYSTEINGTMYRYDHIVEYDLDGNVVWYMDVKAFCPIEWWCPYEDILVGARSITHANTLFYDPDDDMLYFNPRDLNTFFKINHSSSEVIWGVGEHGNFTLYDINGNEKDNLFYHGHAVEQVDNDTFIIFDNDWHNQTKIDNQASRIIEITINETTMTANESWSWTGSPAYYSYIWGDADRLPNGNRLGVFGYVTHPTAPDIGARIVEVNDAGEIVWEMNFPSSAEYYHGVYRADRVRFAPTLDSPPDVNALRDYPLSISWQAWYDYRAKRTIEGSYSLYLDGAEIENGSVFYDKLWRSVDLTFDISGQDYGVYNYTIAIHNESGNRTVDSINVTIASIVINREGSLSIELGQELHSLTWFGETLSPVSCNITADSINLQSFEWTGSNITIGLETLGIGTHNIELTLHNETVLVYTDSFQVTVFPAEMPIITPLQANPYSRVWNQTASLNWTIFDNTPFSWEVYVNGSVHSEGFWTSNTLQLKWDIPLMNEACYNVSVVATDSLSLKSINQTMLYVLSPSPPIIERNPVNTEFMWGDTDVSFSWVIHGGSSWRIWRNTTLVADGEVIGNEIELEIQNWQHEGWLPGIYNLTLQVSDEIASVTSTVFVDLYVDRGDPYVDAIVASWSNWYMFGENAIGAPDTQDAIIFVDYGNGYLTMDMGINEEIVDGNGDDFNITASGGNYTVYVTPSLDVTFVSIGRGEGNQSFDLSSSSFEIARYVRITYYTDDSIELDAVTAINYNVPEADTFNPQIVNIEDFWVWSNQTSVALTWIASDDTPWNYVVFVNDTLAESGPWNGSTISYTFEPLLVGQVNITLQVFDVFANSAKNEVIIEIRQVPSTSTNPPDIWFAVVVISGTIGVALVLIVVYLVKSKQ